jgi:hypothetical protein
MSVALLSAFSMTLSMVERQDQPGVDDGCSIVIYGGHAPNHKRALAQPIEGDQANNKVSEVLNHWESSKDNPVDEPLGVVNLQGGF